MLSLPALERRDRDPDLTDIGIPGLRTVGVPDPVLDQSLKPVMVSVPFNQTVQTELPFRDLFRFLGLDRDDRGLGSRCLRLWS